MRITNAMVTSNTKSNININKMYHDKTNTQIASGQKIVRPSDDPVIAIRALRLGTNLSELGQFKEKNIPDADAWFKATETALIQTDQLITNIRHSLNQGSSEENNMQSVSAVLQELKQLRTQLYTTGNADNAGRTVFTGYRTSIDLTFQGVPDSPDPTDPTKKLTYEIYEPINATDIDSKQYVNGQEYFDNNTLSTNLASLSNYKEEKISIDSVDRIRLAYDNLTNTIPKIGTLDENGDIDTAKPQITPIPIPTTMTYEEACEDARTGNTSYYVPETGEILLCANDKATFVDEKNMVVQYEKDSWQKGDLRPEHYFMCKSNETSTLYPNGIEYNFNRVDPATGKTVTTGGEVKGFKEQDIVYEIAFGQSIQINTHANDVYFHAMGRDIDELAAITQAVIDCEKKRDVVNAKLEENPNDPDLQAIKKAVDKECTMMHEKMHNMYESALDQFSKYQSTINNEISRVGAMTQRLDLTKNRVEDQYSNVEELADKNINIDLDEIAIDYTSARTALDAARLAAGKISDSTLLNYI